MRDNAQQIRERIDRQGKTHPLGDVRFQPRRFGRNFIPVIPSSWGLGATYYIVQPKGDGCELIDITHPISTNGINFTEETTR